LKTIGLLLFGVLLGFSAPPKLTQRQIRIPLWTDGAGLAPADLTATLEGASSRVLAVKGPGDDLMILIVLDLVGDLSLVDAAKGSLVTAIGSLPGSATVGLLRAQDGLKVLLDPTGDRAALTRAITELPVSGHAGLLDTVETMGRLADSILARSSVRVAILYVTDGDVTNYREDFTNPVINSSDSHDLSRRFPESLILEKISKLDAGLSRQQAPLFIVHLRYRNDRLNEAYQNGLKQLAETTAGTALFCRSSAEIPDAIQKTLDQISSHYSVTLALPERASRNVQVQIESAGRAMSYRTRFVLGR
jgi:hypothetical protein